MRIIGSYPTENAFLLLMDHPVTEDLLRRIWEAPGVEDHSQQHTRYSIQGVVGGAFNKSSTLDHLCSIIKSYFVQAGVNTDKIHISMPDYEPFQGRL